LYTGKTIHWILDNLNNIIHLNYLNLSILFSSNTKKLKNETFK